MTNLNMFIIIRFEDHICIPEDHICFGSLFVLRSDVLSNVITPEINQTEWKPHTGSFNKRLRKIDTVDIRVCSENVNTGEKQISGPIISDCLRLCFICSKSYICAELFAFWVSFRLQTFV